MRIQFSDHIFDIKSGDTRYNKFEVHLTHWKTFLLHLFKLLDHCFRRFYNIVTLCLFNIFYFIAEREKYSKYKVLSLHITVM